jgi:hypothetical protein
MLCADERKLIWVTIDSNQLNYPLCTIMHANQCACSDVWVNDGFMKGVALDTVRLTDS